MPTTLSCDVTADRPVQRDENGKPYVLESVLKAEDILHKQRSDKEYLPITVSISRTLPVMCDTVLKDQGAGDFTKLASELAYGKQSKPLAEGKVSEWELHTETNPADCRLAVHLGHRCSTDRHGLLVQFLPRAQEGLPPGSYLGQPHPARPVERPGGRPIQVSRCWLKARDTAKAVRYFDKKTVGLDFEGMKEDLQKAEDGSVVSTLMTERCPWFWLTRQILLHACAQNPTGIDPTQEQWKELSELVKSKKHLALFDMVRAMLQGTANRADST